MTHQLIQRADAKAQGLKTYFTGKPCPRGHIAVKQTSSKQCVECRKIIGRIYTAKDPEKNRAKTRAWLILNKDRATNTKRAYTAANKALLAEKKAAWGNANRTAIMARQRKWAQENPEKDLAPKRNYRARLRRAVGTHTASDVIDILRRQKGKCAYCKVALRGKHHVDHIEPLVRGGANYRANLQALCKSCNMRKNGSDPIEFAQKLGMLL